MRNVLKPVLEKYGIKWTGAMTGTYEGRNIPEADIRSALREFWTKTQTLSGAHIDHFWMYADKDRKKSN